MKRIICLVTSAFVAAVILVPTVAMAQDEDTMMPERNVVEVKSVEEITSGPLPKSGGPGVPGASVLLPAAALLLGSGVLVYGVLRRRG